MFSGMFLKQFLIFLHEVFPVGGIIVYNTL